MSRPLDRIPRWLRLNSTQWAIVLGSALLAALVGMLLQSQKQATYSATAKVLFRNAGLDQVLFSAPVFSGSSQPDRDAATNVALILSNTVAERVAEASGLPPTAAEGIRKEISVGSDGNTDIALITAIDPDPEQAARIANAWAEQFRQSRIDADRDKVQEALDAAAERVEQLQKSGATEAEIERQRANLDNLSLLSSVQLGNVEIADRATIPTAPVQASLAQIGLGIFLLQGLLSLGLMAGYRRLRDPVDDAEDLESLKLPVLAELPRAGRLMVAQDAPSAESFESGLRLLLGNLNFGAAPGAMVASIQSTRPSEGKSTISYHLARVAARSGLNVCLVDADLRFRTITRGVGDPHRAGLTTILDTIGPSMPGDIGVRIDEALMKVDRFDLLGAGPPTGTPGDLAVREMVPDIVDVLRHRYDLVIIDGPPFLGLPDAARFLQASDAVVIVVRRRAARLYQVRRLIDRLRVLGAEPVGIVLNMAAPRDEDLAYGYNYGPRSAREKGSDTRSGRDDHHPGGDPNGAPQNGPARRGLPTRRTKPRKPPRSSSNL